jgi:hypothetical protein
MQHKNVTNYRKIPYIEKIRSRASISKQTKQHILKAFNKIKEISHGDNGNVMKKYKIVQSERYRYGLGTCR